MTEKIVISFTSNYYPLDLVGIWIKPKYQWKKKLDIKLICKKTSNYYLDVSTKTKKSLDKYFFFLFIGALKITTPI